MKSVLIIGNKIYHNSNINEKFDIKNFFNKNTWLGNLLSFIPGFAKPEKEKELDAYQIKTKAWIDKWKSQREEDLKKDMNHKLNVRIRRFDIDQQKKYNKHLADRKVKEYRQQEEENAQKSLQTQLKREESRIKNYVMGPTTPEVITEFIKHTNELYETSTPAEQKIKDNIVGMLAHVYYNDQGEWESNEENRRKRAEILKSKFGDDPELVNKLNEYIETAPKDETEFKDRVTNIALNDTDLKSNEELSDDKDKIQKYMDTLNELESSKNSAKKSYDDAKSNYEKLDKKREAAEQAKKDMDELDKLSAKGVRDNLKNNITQQEDDEPIFIATHDGETNGQTNYKYTYNPKSKKAQQLKALYKNPDDAFNNCCDGSGENVAIDVKKLTSQLEEKFDDEACEELKKKQKKEYQKTIDSWGDDQKTAYEDLKKSLDPKNSDGVASALANSESKLDIYKTSNDADNAKELIKEYAGVKPGADITQDDMAKSISSIETIQNDKAKAAKEIDSLRQKFNKDLVDSDKDEKIKNAIANFSNSQKQELDSLSPNFNAIVKKDTDGKEYIETDVSDPKNPNQKLKLYKPDKNSPNYDEEMKNWDLALQAKLADSKLTPSERPEVSDPTNFEQVKAQKQWDVNKRAKESAKQKLIDDYVKTQKEKGSKAKDDELANDALDLLDDREFLKDAGEFEDVEDDDEELKNMGGDDETEVNKSKADYDKKKEEYDKIKNDPDKSQEEKDQAKKDLEDAEQKIKDTESKLNPSKIWHRKKKKNGSGTTKRYYNKTGDSISTREYKEKVERFKKSKSSKESFDNKRPIIFEKRAWVMTPLSKYKK